MGILAVVADYSAWRQYPAPCLPMAETALPIAMAHGNWAAVGDIRWAQIRPMGDQGWLRLPNLTQAATEAYAKAGKEPPAFTEWKVTSAALMPQLREYRTEAGAMVAAFPAPIRSVAESLLDAFERAEDSRASGQMGDLLEAAADAPPQVRQDVHYIVCGRRWLPGTERLLPELRRRLVETERDDPSRFSYLANHLLLGCWWGWSGSRDAWLETYSWCLQTVRDSRIPTYLWNALGLPIKSVRPLRSIRACGWNRPAPARPSGPS